MSFDNCIWIKSNFISGQSDFESLMPISFVNETEIRLFTSNDQITLEYDDSVILTFTPDNTAFITGLEAQGEYTRDTATVNIIDNDSKGPQLLNVCLTP